MRLLDSIIVGHVIRKRNGEEMDRMHSVWMRRNAEYRESQRFRIDDVFLIVWMLAPLLIVLAFMLWAGNSPM